MILLSEFMGNVSLIPWSCLDPAREDLAETLLHKFLSCLHLLSM